MLAEVRPWNSKNLERRALPFLRWTIEDEKRLVEKKLLEAVGRVLGLVTVQSGPQVIQLV